MSAPISAAELQKRHALEGAPDPFPALLDEPIKAKPSRALDGPLDTGSEQAFPSLAPGGPKQPSANASAWSTASPRIKATVTKATAVQDSFTLPSIDLSNAGGHGRAATLADVVKNVQSKFKVKTEVTTNRKTGQATFVLKGESEKDIDKARRYVIGTLSPVTTIKVDAPASTIAMIIGPKGSTLNQIREQTLTRIDIPRKETLAPPANGNGTGTPGPSSRSISPSAADEEEEPSVSITISGPESLVHEAATLIKQIIASKVWWTTQRVRDVPENILPFVLASKAQYQAAAGGADVTLSLNEKDREISVNGEREGVVAVVEKIKASIEDFRNNLTSLQVSIPKRQHRLLVGKDARDVFVESKCVVVVPKSDQPGDQVQVWGRASDLPGGLAAVMQKANSQYVKAVPLPGPAKLSAQLLSYLSRTAYLKTLASAHSDIAIYAPNPEAAENSEVVNVDFVGEQSIVDRAVKQFNEFIGKLVTAVRTIEIDWLLHRIVTGKSAKKIKQYHEVHNVVVFFPPESAESSSVLLVYDPLSQSGSAIPAEKAKHLDEVEKDLLKLAREAADVKSQTITVEKKWHEAILGPNGTTLNAIIGEDKALSIKVGLDAGAEDDILVRGTTADVDRAVAEIYRIVEEAKRDEIDNSYSAEFEIDKTFVGRIVGAHGSGVNKLRESLGVKVDFDDDVEEKDTGKKKKSAPSQKSKVKIVGRKENVEEAKKRILTQVERLADETTETIKIPRQYHPSLIGPSGKYVVRLEEKYSVKIAFGRDEDASEGKNRDGPKADEVMIKGGKKGVSSAKAELVDAYEFEKESNNVIKFTIPTRTVARVLGKGGANINEIKDNTGTQIDIDRSPDETITNVSIRGSKKSIAEAKAAILAISDQAEEEVTLFVSIENKLHRTIIGHGGQGLKDIIAKCGGPSDSKAQAGLVHFPRQGETADEIRLRGEKNLVNKIKVELEKAAASIRDRVVIGHAVPAAQHRVLIGRGGQHLTDMQNRAGAQVQFPGSRSYSQVGEPINAEDLKDVEPQDLVKIIGPRAACDKMIEEIQAALPPPSAGRPTRNTPQETVQATVEVPLKYHHVISQSGNFFRNLRSFGVQVDQSVQPEKPATPSRPPTSGALEARIDDPEPDASTDIQWQVIPNYQDAEEGTSEWTLKARDQAGLEKAQAALAEAIEHAEQASHVGFLTLPDRSVFPRIVGAKGSNVARLRAQTGAEITVGREDNTIVIIGTESALEAAKEAILQTASSRQRNRERD